MAEHKHVLTNYYPTASPRLFVRVTHSPDAAVCFVLIIFPNLSPFEKHSFGVSVTTSLSQRISMQCKERNHLPHSTCFSTQAAMMCTMYFFAHVFM